jgi:hypothetical protein
MSRTLKALPIMLAVAALGVIAASCGSSNQTQVRVIDAIPDSGPTDIWFNGTRIVTSMQFGQVFPTPGANATYFKIASGSDLIQGFEPGDSTDPISPIGTVLLNGSTKYTVLAVGLEADASPPLVLIDDNIPPTSNNLEFRIVDASPSSPATGVDIYIVPPGTNLTTFTPQISVLGNGQGSAYQNVPFIAGGYAVIVTQTGKKTALITQLSAAPAGSITTIVLLDNPSSGGILTGMSQAPLVLDDLN